jgi:hypothetical protein
VVVILDLDPNVEKGLTAQAEKRGVTLKEYLQEVVARESTRLPPAMHTTGKDRARAFELWAKGHRHTPPLSDEAVSRASLVREVL